MNRHAMLAFLLLSSPAMAEENNFCPYGTIGSDCKIQCPKGTNWNGAWGEGGFDSCVSVTDPSKEDWKR